MKIIMSKSKWEKIGQMAGWNQNQQTQSTNPPSKKWGPDTEYIEQLMTLLSGKGGRIAAGPVVIEFSGNFLTTQAMDLIKKMDAKVQIAIGEGGKNVIYIFASMERSGKRDDTIKKLAIAYPQEEIAPIDVGGYMKILGFFLSEYNTETDYGYATALLAVCQFDDGTIDEEPVSVNIVEYANTLNKDEFFVKTWSEGEAIAKALLENGILQPIPEKTLRGNFDTVPLACKLTDKGKSMVKTREEWIQIAFDMEEKEEESLPEE